MWDLIFIVKSCLLEWFCRGSHATRCHAEALINIRSGLKHTHMLTNQTEHLLNSSVVWVSPPKSQEREKRNQTESCQTSWCSCSLSMLTHIISMHANQCLSRTDDPCADSNKWSWVQWLWWRVFDFCWFQVSYSSNWSYKNQIYVRSFNFPPPVFGVDAAEGYAVHWVMSPEEKPRRREWDRREETF